jgi:anti-sigma regulatory factor (Ser/Thr protein kinase)
VNHVVHFYGTDDERADSVVRYLTDGIRSSVLAGHSITGPAPGGFGPHPAVADQRSFPGERNSVRAARHYVTGLLGRGADADEAAAYDTAIVATELAANAVLHARTRFTLTVSRSAGVTRIAVRDSTPVGLLAVTGPRATGGGVPFQVMRGHGLSVVAQLASRWAVEPLPDGKVVWAELPAPRPAT